MAATITKDDQDFYIEGLSSGYKWIDSITNIPDVLFPFGTICEVGGLKSTGKTSLVLESLGHYQRTCNKKKILYCDFEKTLKKQAPYCMALGLDTAHPNFDYQQFDTQESGIEYILKILKNKQSEYAAIVVDTVAAMRPAKELTAGLDATKEKGLKARLFTFLLRNMTADLQPDGPACIFINQLHIKLEINNPLAARLPTQYETSSSNALKFFASARYFLKTIAKVKTTYYDNMLFTNVNSFIANVNEIVAEKSKIGLPYRKTEFVMRYGYGVDLAPTLIRAGLNKSGFRDKAYVQGTDLDSTIIRLTAKNTNYAYCISPGEYSQVVRGEQNFIDFIRSSKEAQLCIANQLSDLWVEQVNLISKSSSSAVPPLPSQTVDSDGDSFTEGDDSVNFSDEQEL